jgi:uncharacterized repeat protein (TIGR03806 family)
VLDLSGTVNTSSEGGLLGLAFAPDFATSGVAYVYYTRRRADGTGMQSALSRFKSPDGGLTLDPGSEEVLLTVEQPFNNHNGGGIHFGPDGYLYLGLGDGGSGGDPQNNAQTTTNLLGTFIRIDVSAGGHYTIPADNPFAGNPRCTTGIGTTDCPEIHAWGLRNPWRWSFDRATGVLWAGDVGERAREEIDIIARSGNYGWRFREGTLCHNPPDDCPTAGLTEPVIDYDRALGGSVTGGYVYRGELLASLAGRYIFGDFVSGRIWVLQANEDGGFDMVELATTGLSISTFGEANDGELYVVDIAGGGLYQLQPPGSAAADTIPERLSDTGCVDPADPALPAAGLIPYAPAAPFWSDGTGKERWLAVPDGTDITVAADGEFGFPPGSVLVKHFRLDGRLVETRLFMRHPDGSWAGYTWGWNAAGTEAFRITGGATVEIGSQVLHIPSEAECMQCHTAAAGRTLGLEVAQLNHELDYPQTGRVANQLVTLDAIGLLSPPLGSAPDELPALPDPFGTAPLAERARAYLHSNCAGCHRAGGPTSSDMDWRYDLPLADTGSCDVPGTTSATLDVQDARIVAPGDQQRSLAWLRMGRRDAHAMPPVGSRLSDDAGLALIGAWIDGLAGCAD